MIVIEVRGLPAPQGSKRHVGNGIMVESSKAVGPWREAVRAETQRARQVTAAAPMGGAVYVEVIFALPRPRGHWRTGRNAGILRGSAPAYPSGRPDLDKLLRAVLDGLTMGGAWKDDAQVALVNASKVYGDPGCRIAVGELEAGGC